MSNSLYYPSEEKQEKREAKPTLAEEVAELKGIVAKQTEQICSLLEELAAPVRKERCERERAETERINRERKLRERTEKKRAETTELVNQCKQIKDYLSIFRTDEHLQSYAEDEPAELREMMKEMQTWGPR
jgi:uncharacterized membrane protein YgaE (UPF0421/DUF939 family)